MNARKANIYFNSIKVQLKLLADCNTNNFSVISIP